MLVKRTVGARGQVVLPKDIREQFGLREGTEIAFEARENEVVIRPAKTPEQIVEEFCNTSRKINIKEKGGAKWIKKVIEEQYEEEYGLH
ncbi:AbrB/MazE/SpoVT family DNA-binding domain-containing protein [Candidatus Woesearchaeota archaeon]|nr:AbrB/MazE/SpoVT family DNA-binding domain-containing protein [Candidatus Woesearchaeota archaeon]